MKKEITVLAFFVFLLADICGQQKQTIVILPFSGIERGAIPAGRLETDMRKQNAFNSFAISRIEQIISELRLAADGLTDPETVKNIADVLRLRCGVAYIVLGRAVTVGRKKILITSIVNPETIEQIAGDFRIYDQESDIYGLIPEIAKNLSAVSQRTGTVLYQTAVPRFAVNAEQASAQGADALAQIFACAIASTGKYRVLPRTKEVETAIAEMRERREKGIGGEGAGTGKAINPRYLFSGSITEYGQLKLFDIQWKCPPKKRLGIRRTRNSPR
jgi:hypothetical protein